MFYFIWLLSFIPITITSEPDYWKTYQSMYNPEGVHKTVSPEEMHDMHLSDDEAELEHARTPEIRTHDFGQSPRIEHSQASVFAHPESLHLEQKAKSSTRPRLEEESSSLVADTDMTENRWDDVNKKTIDEKYPVQRMIEYLRSLLPDFITQRFGAGDLGNAQKLLHQSSRDLVYNNGELSSNPELITAIKHCDTYQKQDLFNKVASEISEYYKTKAQLDPENEVLYKKEFEQQIIKLTNNIRKEMLNPDQRIEKIFSANSETPFDFHFQVEVNRNYARNNYSNNENTPPITGVSEFSEI